MPQPICFGIYLFFKGQMIKFDNFCGNYFLESRVRVRVRGLGLGLELGLGLGLGV